MDLATPRYHFFLWETKYDIKTKRNCKTYFFDCIKWNYYWINCFLAYSICLKKICMKNFMTEKEIMVNLVMDFLRD